MVAVGEFNGGGLRWDSLAGGRVALSLLSVTHRGTMATDDMLTVKVMAEMIGLESVALRCLAELHRL